MFDEVGIASEGFWRVETAVGNSGAEREREIAYRCRNAVFAGCTDRPGGASDQGMQSGAFPAGSPGCAFTKENSPVSPKMSGASWRQVSQSMQVASTKNDPSTFSRTALRRSAIPIFHGTSGRGNRAETRSRCDAHCAGEQIRSRAGGGKMPGSGVEPDAGSRWTRRCPWTTPLPVCSAPRQMTLPAFR